MGRFRGCWGGDFGRQEGGTAVRVLAGREA